MNTKTIIKAFKGALDEAPFATVTVNGTTDTLSDAINGLVAAGAKAFEFEEVKPI